MSLLLSIMANAQIFPETNDTIPRFLASEVEVMDKDFLNKYNFLKPKVLKVYPYALYAADLLDQMNNDLERIEKRRKQNKFCKESYDYLKENFKYVLLDMYSSEGEMLIKLVARETNMTVYEIIQKYRGQKDAMVFNVMGKMWDQDIKTPYNPNKEYVIERIIQDIESGKIKFDDTVISVSKDDYKESKKETKEKMKENKKKKKAKKKLEKKSK